MLASRALIYRSASRLSSGVAVSKATKLLSAGPRTLGVFSASIEAPPYWWPRRNFADATAVRNDAESPGFVSRPLRALKMNVVHNILEELKSVDTDSDGRIDTEELKTLLRRRASAFTEDEIVEIGELFYAGMSGGSVAFDRLIEAMDRVVQLETKDGKPIGKDSTGNILDLGTCGNEYLFFKTHSTYTKEDLTGVTVTHVEPQNIRDRLAFAAVKGVRFLFDKATGWDQGEITKSKILVRAIYLETIAAVPGMVAAIVRHFRSLRNMERDGGMMQMFLDEANNERMHLLTFVRLRNPGSLFRAAVIAGQFGFGSAFLLCYIVSPKFCHRFVGYIEEEAVSTYTKIIHAIEEAPDGSDLGQWKVELAPKIARSYWKLGQNGTVLELMYAVRADEAEHRDVNHLCSEIAESTANPVSNTEQKLNEMLLKYVQDMMEKNPDKPIQSSNTKVAHA